MLALQESARPYDRNHRHDRYHSKERMPTGKKDPRRESTHQDTQKETLIREAA